MLAECIKKFAKEKGLPLYEIENKLGLASGSISKWNDVKPSYDKVVAVSRLLGVTVEELLEG